MNQFILEEIFSLAVTLAFLVMLTILLLTGVVAHDDTLVNTIVTVILTYWFLNAAYRFGQRQAQASQSSTPGGQEPQPPPAQAA